MIFDLEGERLQVSSKGRRALATVLAAVAVFAAAAIADQLQPTTYTATSVFTVVPRNGSQASADVVRLLAASFVPYLASPGVADQVGGVTGQAGAMVAAGTAVSVDPGTANVRIEATLPAAQNAAAVANRLAEAGVIKAAQDPLVTAELVAPALAEAVRTNPPRMLIMLGAAVAAVLIGAVVWSALGRRPRRSE